MSDDRVRTFVKLQGTACDPVSGVFRARAARAAWSRKSSCAVSRRRSPLPAALEAIRKSAGVILAPSNPFVSFGPIFGLDGVRKALGAARDRVAAISPIVGGKTIKGPADKMLRGLGHEVSPLGIARLYKDFAGIFVLDQLDRRYLEPIRELGMRAIATDTIMTHSVQRPPGWRTWLYDALQV